MRYKEDHIACIKMTHQLLNGYTWCGERINGFCLVDVDHALNCLSNQTYVQPCPECLERVRLVLDELTL